MTGREIQGLYLYEEEIFSLNRLDALKTPGQRHMTRKKRKQYDRDFKIDAVRVANSDPNLSITKAARRLGLDRQLLWSWIKEVDEKGYEGAFPGPGRRAPLQMFTAENKDQLRQAPGLTVLRAENQRLRLELEKTRAERDTLEHVLDKLLTKVAAGEPAEENKR